MMRIEVMQKASVSVVDGIRLDAFHPGVQYERGNCLGALLLAEPQSPVREVRPPAYEGPPALALDQRRRSRTRSS